MTVPVDVPSEAVGVALRGLRREEPPAERRAAPSELGEEPGAGRERALRLQGDRSLDRPDERTTRPSCPELGTTERVLERAVRPLQGELRSALAPGALADPLEPRRNAVRSVDGETAEGTGRRREEPVKGRAKLSP